MPSKPVTVHSEVGLHARPAARFAKAAGGYAADVRIIKDGTDVDAKSLLSVLKLDVRHGDEITISTEGEDAERALAELVGLLEEL
jgi:phosphocarrier protein HPr